MIENDWNLDSINEIYKIDDVYLVVKAIDERLHILAKFKQKPDEETVERLTKNKVRNPNGSKYGLNITKVFDTYIIRKRIAGEDCIFGYYANLEDAQFVRNFLMDHNWNVNSFSQIEHDEEASTFKVVEVINDRIYVLGTFKTKEEVDVDECHAEFLGRITKHKLGFGQYPELDELTDMIPELEEMFNATAQDDIWSFKDTDNPLNDIVFNLAPFQKSVYDVIDDSTFDDIKKSMIRYKSKNFDEKIQKNLDELEESGLVGKNNGHYFKK